MLSQKSFSTRLKKLVKDWEWMKPHEHAAYYILYWTFANYHDMMKRNDVFQIKSEKLQKDSDIATSVYSSAIAFLKSKLYIRHIGYDGIVYFEPAGVKAAEQMYSRIHADADVSLPAAARKDTAINAAEVKSSLYPELMKLEKKLLKLTSDFQESLDSITGEIAEQRLKYELRYFLDDMNNTISSVGLAYCMFHYERDDYTIGHQLNVAYLTREISKICLKNRYKNEFLLKKKIYEYTVSAMLHDIGKYKVPRSIIEKSSRLNDDDIRHIEKHPHHGAEMITLAGFGNNELLANIHTISLQHHERINGTGYPKKLKAEKITEGARIVAVADVAEAILGDRPHRPSRSAAEAKAELRTELRKKGHYDPDIANVCLDLIESGKLKFPIKFKGRNYNLHPEEFSHTIKDILTGI
ncbi:MAG TPA: HD domain-containing phosphohydrolase [Spirochaetota bacterium]|nr:HD domain-containing phosphohydrolase [Spirochaetota bacterium]